MKNTMKTMILGFLVLTLALGFTSCGDKEDDPTPSNPNEITFNQLLGTYNTESVLFEGKTYTDPCDPWPTTKNTENLREITLKFKSGNLTDLTNYMCKGGVNSTFTHTDNVTSVDNNVIDIDKVYVFEIISLSNGTLKVKLTSTSSPTTTPIGAIYTLKKV